MANTIRDFIVIFASILYEAMPFVVLGATIAGILEVLSPRQAFAFMMGVSAVLLGLIIVPLPLPLRLAIGITAGLTVMLALLQVGEKIGDVLEFLGQRRTTAIAMSGLLGLIMPMCECGIVPVMRRLLRKGMPLSCCIAYLLAGPIINIVVLLSTYMAFAGMEGHVDATGRLTYQIGGIGMVLLRGGLGWLVAVATGLIVERQFRRYGYDLLLPLARPGRVGEPAVEAAFDPPRASSGPATQIQEESPVAGIQVQASPSTETPGRRVDPAIAPASLKARVGLATETALHDFVDITVFLILGAILASVVRTGLPANLVEEVSRNHPTAAIGAMMFLAVLLCLCSEADAFVAASLTALRPAAKLAFLVLGPMLDLKLYMMYLRVFRPRLIWTIIPCVVIQVLIYSLIVHFLWETYAPRLRSAFPAGP